MVDYQWIYLPGLRKKPVNTINELCFQKGQKKEPLKAADEIIRENLSEIILIGDPKVIADKADEFGLKDVLKATIVDPKSHDKKADYVSELVELRKHKGMTEEKAETLMEDPLYLAVMMIKKGDADGEVAGADNATGDVLRPAFQIVKTKPGVSVVSGAFFMIIPDKSFGDDGLMVFADCAVHPNPTASELAEIAVCTGENRQSNCGY